MASANTPTAMRVKSEAEMVEAGAIALASEESALHTHTGVSWVLLSEL